MCLKIPPRVQDPALPTGDAAKEGNSWGKRGRGEPPESRHLAVEVFIGFSVSTGPDAPGERAVHTETRPEGE